MWTATNMTKQWTLPQRGKPSELIDVAPSNNRKIIKFTDTKQPTNNSKQSQVEVAMVKYHQTELIRQWLGLESERDQHKIRSKLRG